jgi:hypothetical protein
MDFALSSVSTVSTLSTSSAASPGFHFNFLNFIVYCFFPMIMIISFRYLFVYFVHGNATASYYDSMVVIQRFTKIVGGCNNSVY